MSESTEDTLSAMACGAFLAALFIIPIFGYYYRELKTEAITKGYAAYVLENKTDTVVVFKWKDEIKTDK
jgi:hypothetical protein